MPSPTGLRPPTPNPGSHWALGFVALLLLVLNLLTPGLLNGPAAGFLGEGTLYVSSTPGGALSFVVETEGHLELARVVVALNLSASTSPGNATTYRHWDRWVNSSDVVAATFNVTSVSFVVNVTAWYANGTTGSGPSAPTATIGTFAFLLASSSSGLQLTVTPLYPLSGTWTLPDGGTPSTWSTADLPVSLPLAQPPASVTGPAPLGIPQGGGGPP